MDTKYVILGVAILCLLVALAGCNAVDSTTPTASDRSDDRGRNSITIHDLNHTESSFYVNASISYVKPPNRDNITFEGVMACLYDSSGNVLNTTEIGDFTGTHDSGNFVLSADERPHYIVVDHPKYHEYSDMQPALLRWTEDDYFLEYHGSLADVQDDFEYPRHNETGRCL